MIKAFKKNQNTVHSYFANVCKFRFKYFNISSKEIWYRELKLHKVDLTSQSIPMVESLMISMIKNR